MQIGNGNDDARKYLATVVPWSEDGKSLVNIHWTFKPKDAKRATLPGRACRTIDEACKNIDWVSNKGDNSDIYVCMSSQLTGEERKTEKGYSYYKAIRNQNNVYTLKSLFIDLDIKDGAYSSPAEAIGALTKFLADTKLPRPTVIVGSGGGLHIYWVLDVPISREEWQPLANGLAEATKQFGFVCDTQCTVDSVRVLRVPGTLNHKTNPPLPVKLLSFNPENIYSIDRITELLAPYTKGEVFSTLPRGLPPIIGDDELSAGIDITKTKIGPVKLKDALPECQFLSDAVTHGGKTYNQALWNYTTLIAVFTEKGDVNAHLMARGHPEYTKESTDELFERKVNERDERDLGWPSCNAISGAGYTGCQSCKHFGKGKSPLSFAGRSIPQAAVALQAGPGGAMGIAPVGTAAPVSDLPRGYQRDANGIIRRIVVQPEDNTTELVPVCKYPMTDGWLQTDPPLLNFMTITSAGNKRQVAIATEIIGTADLRKALQGRAGGGMMLNQFEVKAISEFFVSWIQELQKHKDKVVSSAPFGWKNKGASTQGFIYAGQLWMPNGETMPAASADAVLASHYEPCGSLDPWKDAAEMVTLQNCAALNAIVATAFACPLVKFTGHQGLQMSAYSMRSGIGKTTAMRVAQSVWGDPVRGMQALNDTENSVVSKIGELKSIPLYWDELKSSEDVKQMVRIIFRMTSGRGKSRLNTRVEQRAVNMWESLLVTASNESLVDAVAASTRMTTAGVSRIFEFEVPIPTGEGKLPVSVAQRRSHELNTNYGQAGIVYSQWLGENFVEVDKEVSRYALQVEELLGVTQEERFWASLIACICLGARYANFLSLTKIDEDQLRLFMIAEFENMRVTRKSKGQNMEDDLDVSNMFSAFLNANIHKHAIWTNRIHIGRGKPPDGTISVIRPADPSRLQGIYIHIGQQDKILRISSNHLSEWCSDHGISRQMFTKALEDQFGLKRVNGRIASGTPYAGITEYLLEIQLAGTSHANFIDET